MIIAAILMCSFFINWIHFNQIVFSMYYTELAACLGLGILLAILLAKPAVFAAGPILIYLISPKWRKPI
jgi:hypothetical protein